MRPKLYMCEICPCARAVILTAKVLGLTLELIEMDPSKENPINKNQQHCIPILKDSGYVIWDAHAIIAYLVGKYGQDEALYPRESHRRAVIDQRLLFDSLVVAFVIKTILNPFNYDDNVSQITEIYDIVEHFFDDNNQWVAGENLTIADLTLISSITSLDVVVPINEEKYPKLQDWIWRAQEMPFYDANKTGLYRLKTLLLGGC